MAAPTPVRALVHSSTLVTAGIYILLRLNFIIEIAGLSYLVFLLGLRTIIIARLRANLEQDIKKIIALSTLRQLGLIITSLGLGLILITFFHLLTHAIFKSLLFICRGDVIHQNQGLQDLRFLGGSLKGRLFARTLINICNLALCGFPFLAGFYSKDAIIEIGYSSSYSLIFLYLIAFRVGLSGSYSMRLYYFRFLNESQSRPLGGIYESVDYIFKSKFLLFGFTLTGGLVLSYCLFETPLIVFLKFNEKIITLIRTF
ncbi:NADH dehydrogenase subunit 5, partial [Marinomonas sp. KMM3893]